MKKAIIITGVDGLLGGVIAKRILNETDFCILGLTMNMNWTDRMMTREGIEKTDRINFMLNADFLNSKWELVDIFGAVHLAFSRRMQPAKDIASSIDFASDIFHRLAELGVDRVINMSSQGVYGNTEEIRTERTPAAPDNHYTMAKYATEKLMDDIIRDTPHHTNFRLDPVAPSQNVVKGLCKSAKEGHIQLKGGNQVFSFIDPEDVGTAVVSMLMADGCWDGIYNVGWNRKRYTLTELAGIVADATEKCGYKRPVIELEESDISLWAGMDSTRFMEKTGWMPVIELGSTIERMIRG